MTTSKSTNPTPRPFYALTLGEMTFIADMIEPQKDDGVYIMRDAPLELTNKFNFNSDNGKMAHARSLTRLLSKDDMANAVKVLNEAMGSESILNGLHIDDDTLSSLDPKVGQALSLALTRLGESILEFNAPKSYHPDFD